MRILEGLFSSGQDEPTNTCDNTAGYCASVKYTGVVENCREWNTLSLCSWTSSSAGDQSRATNQMTQAVLMTKEGRYPGEDTWCAEVWHQASKVNYSYVPWERAREVLWEVALSNRRAVGSRVRPLDLYLISCVTQRTVL